MFQDTSEYGAAREKFNRLSKPERVKLLETLSKDAWNYFRYQADITLKPHQIIPQTNWRYCFFCGGRGTGKDKLACVEMRKRALSGQQGLMMIAPTFAYLDEPGGMVDSFLKEFPPSNPAQKLGNKIVCPNGNYNSTVEVILKTTQQNNGQIIGSNVSFGWLNELRICWDGIPEKQLLMFKMFDASVRLPGAQLLITTNPDGTAVFKHIMEIHNTFPDLVVLMGGSMYMNDYLDENTKKIFKGLYGGTRYEASELEGKLDFSVQGALWSPDQIEKTRFQDIKSATGQTMQRYGSPWHFFIRIVIGTDPSQTCNETSDDFGVVVCALGRNGHAYVLEDGSKRMKVDDAMNLIQVLRIKYSQLMEQDVPIIAETNGGGDFITYAMRTKDPSATIIERNVRENKMTRAQPIAALWDQGRCHIVGKMPALEDQMCSFTGDKKQESPDRLDAMTLAITELMLELMPVQPRNTPRLR